MSHNAELPPADHPQRLLGLGSAAAVVVGAALMPGLLGSSYTATATDICIWAALAMSLNIIWGLAGMPSFGQAAFFGLGAYAASLVALHLTTNAWMAFLAAALFGGVGALLTGALLLRLGGIYFLMLTLAFGQLFYAIATEWTHLTGGSNGLTDLPALTLPVGVATFAMQDPTTLFRAALVWLAVSVLITYVIKRSTMGLILYGVRDNELRMRVLGYNVAAAKMAAYVLSGSIAGVAGALFSLFQFGSSPGVFNWTTSGDAVIMVIVGGIGTLLGPLVGAAFLVLAQTYIQLITPHWELITGLAFVAVVLVSPSGIVPLVYKFRNVANGGPPSQNRRRTWLSLIRH